MKNRMTNEMRNDKIITNKYPANIIDFSIRPSIFPFNFYLVNVLYKGRINKDKNKGFIQPNIISSIKLN